MSTSVKSTGLNVARTSPHSLKLRIICDNLDKEKLNILAVYMIWMTGLNCRLTVLVIQVAISYHWAPTRPVYTLC
jgi:hypothetical protein